MEYYKVPSKIRAVTDEDLMGLPKGFRFHPTDEEIVVHYLIPKALNSNFRAAAIGQADFNKCEPWDLPKKTNMADTERYYYCQRDRKYPAGLRTNRATKAGYWKATGKDKEIYKGVGAGRELAGMKKTLVFYTGRAPNGEKTNWVMHEFRLQQNGQFSSIPRDDGWVVSRVFHKINPTGGGNHARTASGNSAFSPTPGSDSFSTDDLIIDNTESLPDLVDPSAAPASSNVSNVQDLKRKAVMSISYGYPHQSVNMQANTWLPNNSTIDAYDDDQLIYSDDPDYYYPSLSETLFQTLDSLGYDNLVENKSISGTTSSVMDKYICKVEQQCPSSSAISAPLQDTSNNNVEVSFDGQEYDTFPLSSTMGSKLWD